jgi:hypothetical protein
LLGFIIARRVSFVLIESIGPSSAEQICEGVWVEAESFCLQIVLVDFRCHNFRTLSVNGSARKYEFSALLFVPNVFDQVLTEVEEVFIELRR